MIVRLVLTFLAVYLGNALLVAGSACAQTSGLIKVSDAIEAPNSPFTGGVSAARCGTNIVVGFGDQERSTPNSFAGYAVSGNNGTTFTDRGVLPVFTDSSAGLGPDELGADVGFPANNGEYPAAITPSVACVNSSLFYYASVYTDRRNTSSTCVTGPVCSAISLSISKNGGATWSLPTLVATASGDIHDLVFPSMSVDPSNPQRLYVAYLNHNFAPPYDSGFLCGAGDRYEMRLASSMDAGKTWADNVVDYGCTDPDVSAEIFGEITSPSIAVSPDGKVYVAYQFIPQGSPGQLNQIRFSRSLDHGQTFSAPLKISAALGNSTPKLAVDRTHSRHRGEIYVTWSGKPTGTYTDVMVSDSLNAGLSFSFPRPISATPAVGTGRFQSNPVVAVDNDGQAAVCFYNAASNQPTSSSVYSYGCATTFNHAATWQVQRVVSSAPVGYDALSTDFLLHTDGFFTTFELQANGQKHLVGKKTDLN